MSEVQRYACRALANLAGNAANEERIVSSGGLDHIYTAMAAHVAMSEVQRYACMALANLAGNAANEERIVSSGGLDHIYTAMAAHMGVPDAQWRGVMCLYNLSLSPANLPALKAGRRAAAALRAALAAHPTHADIQELAPKALACLA
jgi:hypothetical protein